MKNAQVICLGSWPGSAKPHIEVESIEFLKGLTSSKNLRFLSLQGISRITELPDSVSKHSNLVILDLKECHNLEMLPEEIIKLKKLRYLDLSDCYLLAHMPQGLGALSELQVLKGFVIGNSQRKSSGTLDDLKGLRKLRKLTINASSEEFPTPDDLCALNELGEKGVLRKLTIAWGAKLADQEGNGAKREDQNGREGNCWKRIPCSKQQKSKTRNDQQVGKLPMKLRKLDLQCFPMSKAKWLTPNSLPHLKKLYIRGGNLATLEDLDKKNWLEVKTLRLKYLGDLKMTWIKMQESFPKLKYLEKVKCPGITLCPCDEHGVWMTDES
ncbi:disease resistance RPP13-like protein 4 [Castanea sativa]|uniref:disease resistance RPP13-like protein 4 n=1 Tax=Castanea sativa TaxID=21020 RepID=UPI003F64DE9C